MGGAIEATHCVGGRASLCTPSDGSSLSPSLPCSPHDADSVPGPVVAWVRSQVPQDAFPVPPHGPLLSEWGPVQLGVCPTTAAPKVHRGAAALSLHPLHHLHHPRSCSVTSFLIPPFSFLRLLFCLSFWFSLSFSLHSWACLFSQAGAVP